MNMEIRIMVLGKMVSACRDGKGRRKKGGEEKVRSQLKLFMADFPEIELSWTLTEEDKMQEPDHKHDNEEEKEGNSD